MKSLKLNAPLIKHGPIVKVSSKLPVGDYVVQLTVKGRSGQSIPAKLTIRVAKENS
jgi:hypothetical protein